MSGILDLLKSDMGKELINGASKEFGINKASVGSVLGSAMPLILGALNNNASSVNGSEGLLKALGDSRHSGGSILDNLSSILGGGNSSGLLTDGANILSHIFGGQEQNAATALGESNGINISSVMNIMKMAAPFVMGYLGNKAKDNNVSNQVDLKDLLGGLLGDDKDTHQEMANKIQDFENNDDTVGDIAELITKYDKKSGGIGNILSDLFS